MLMEMLPPTLSFSAVDDLGFAASGARLDLDRLRNRYVPSSLGPLIELLYLVAGGRLPSALQTDWLADNGACAMVSALRDNHDYWVQARDRRIGFVRAIRGDRYRDADALFTSFLMDAQCAAREVTRLPGRTPGQLVAAMQELENNVHEHSEAAHTGVLAFRATRRVFEFVVADSGIGVLRSLQRCPRFAYLQDHGEALEKALSDGISRFGEDTRRGHGFRPIFVGLANLRASLRFRSGDYALTIDGTSPTLATAQLAQKPMIDGFLVSIQCNAS
jgi:hypothetical protein